MSGSYSSQCLWSKLMAVCLPFSLLPPLLWFFFKYKCVSRSFQTELITKSTTTTCWEATQRVTVAKLTRLTHKIATQLHVVADSCSNCSSHSRQPVRKLLYTPTYTISTYFFLTQRQLCCLFQSNISFFSNRCSMSNILFLSTAPSTYAVTFMYLFSCFLLKSCVKDHWKNHTDMMWHENHLFEASKCTPVCI